MKIRHTRFYVVHPIWVTSTDKAVKNFTMRKVTKYFSLNIKRKQLNLFLKLRETTLSLTRKEDN